VTFQFKVDRQQFLSKKTLSVAGCWRHYHRSEFLPANEGLLAARSGGGGCCNVRTTLHLPLAFFFVKVGL
jgi:hypothetical protein